MNRFILLILIFYSTNLSANNQKIRSEILTNLSQVNLIGNYDLEVFRFDVYNIKLWSVNNKFDYQNKFAIEINYKMNFTKEKLVKKTVDEISRINNINDQEQLIIYQREFLKLFLDVKKGDCKVAIYYPGKKVDLFLNSKFIGSINDKTLAKYFTDIWLSKESSYPEMTKTILGEKNDH